MLFGSDSTQWTMIGSTASGVAVTLAGVWKLIKTRDPKLASEIPGGVRKVLDEGEAIIEDLAKTPWFASQAASGKLELRHITEKLLQAHIGQAAADALASFGGLAFGDMTEGQKGTAVEMTQTTLKALGQNVTATQAVAALNAAQERRESLAPTALAATERSQALTQSAQQEATASA